MNDFDAQVRELKEAAIALVHEVTAALEGEDEQQVRMYDRVEAFAARYRAFLDSLPPVEKDRAQMQLERRLIDLRRDAAQLQKRVSGAKVERAADFGLPFVERRAPPKSIEPPRHAPLRGAPRFSVGGEVEAWCGKCKDHTEHHVVAMVGDQPKQVICAKCKSRHSYRTEPSTRDKGAAAKTESPQRAPEPYVPVDHEARRKAEIKRQLEEELASAEQPRPYDPRERYKRNEIVYHPEHGRGKIENVLRGSMLVRFRDGLRPLNLK